MERLDAGYLNDLVVKAARGSDNAFAELYAATVQRLYVYAWFQLRDEEAAREVVGAVYALALRGLGAVKSPGLFLPWLCRQCFRQCRARLPHRDGPAASGAAVDQLLALPLSESQALIMEDVQGLPRQQIAEILNFSDALLRRCLRAGRKHLQRSGIPAGKAGAHPGRRIRESAPKLDALAAARLLEGVFAGDGREGNSVPLEALSAYAVYRRERFSLQRGVLIAAMVLFLLLPLLFVTPRFDLSLEETGERGLPVYTVELRSLLPVGRVTARLRSHALPVYEAGARRFTVEPTRNGELTVTVELVNRQARESVRQVTAVDSSSPELLGSVTGADRVLLRVEDSGIGVHLTAVYAVGASGQVYLPLRCDAERGEIEFEYPQENWDVYIPDYIGNTLHLALTLG